MARKTGKKKEKRGTNNDRTEPKTAHLGGGRGILDWRADGTQKARYVKDLERGIHVNERCINKLRMLEETFVQYTYVLALAVQLTRGRGKQKGLSKSKGQGKK